MICMTLDCVRPTKFCVIQTIQLQCWSEVFSSFFTKTFVFVMYAYFIDILQDSVETHLRYGGIYNNHFIANCLQSVPMKEL